MWTSFPEQEIKIQDYFSLSLIFLKQSPRPVVLWEYRCLQCTLFASCAQALHTQREHVALMLQLATRDVSLVVSEHRVNEGRWCLFELENFGSIPSFCPQILSVWSQARHLIPLYLGSICIKQEWKYELRPTPLLSHLVESFFTARAAPLCSHSSQPSGSAHRQWESSSDCSRVAQGSGGQLWTTAHPTLQTAVKPTIAICTSDKSLAVGLSLGLCMLGFTTWSCVCIYSYFCSLFWGFTPQRALFSSWLTVVSCPAASKAWKTEKKVSLIKRKPEPIVYLIWKIDQIIVVFIACWNGRLFWKKKCF